MTGFMSRWVVGLEKQVTDADRDEQGYVSATVLGAWLAEAVDAYLAHCTTLQERAAGRNLVRRPGRQPRTGLLGRPAEVLVTASATEVRPTEFMVSVRVRPYGGDEDLPINIVWRVSIEDSDTGEPIELGNAVRDELIALENAAEYMS